MTKSFEILASCLTAMGELTLRRRLAPSLGNREVYEVKLGDEFLMSSLFHVAEEALADIPLTPLAGDGLDVVVGGLGLGYTAAAALNRHNLRSLLVVEALEPVISWHKEGLVPLGARLSGDSRCRFLHADFFRLAEGTEGRGFDPEAPGRRFHAVLLDIDHSPKRLLNQRHRGFYQAEGLGRLAAQLLPGGLFALWSDDPPQEDFLIELGRVFVDCRAHVVRFPNPILGRDSQNTVYVGRKP